MYHTFHSSNEMYMVFVRLVVGVARDVVDVVVRLLEHDALPLAERGHPRAGAAADDQLEPRVELPHGARGLRGQLCVALGGAVAELPGSVHLVAQAPHADGMRLRGPVRRAQVGQSSPRPDVRVLEDVEGLLYAARAEVDGVHQLAADLARPGRELVQADLVRLGGVPRKAEPARPILPRPDA